jgi:hypothetical protein
VGCQKKDWSEHRGSCLRAQRTATSEQHKDFLDVFREVKKEVAAIGDTMNPVDAANKATDTVINNIKISDPEKYRNLVHHKKPIVRFTANASGLVNGIATMEDLVAGSYSNQVKTFDSRGSATKSDSVTTSATTSDSATTSSSATTIQEKMELLQKLEDLKQLNTKLLTIIKTFKQK